MGATPENAGFIEDSGDGLILRAATVADADALAAFNADLHRVPAAPEPDEGMAVWTHDLLERPHPTMLPGDITVVEDRRTGQLVSTQAFIPQTWAYGGVPFGVGQIELVGTHPAYRRRGLVRRQMDLVHRWSRERGHLVQAIMGIANYYRRFGYEYALAGRGGCGCDRSRVPDLPTGETEPVQIRPATEADIPFLERIEALVRDRALVTAMRSPEHWRYELSGQSASAIERREYRIVEMPDGTPVGLLFHPHELWSRSMVATGYELLPGVSWLAITPAVLRYLRATGDGYAKRSSGAVDAVRFVVGNGHPVCRALPERLNRPERSYAWYLRVPDLPAFLGHVTPVLERRLAGSVAAGHTATLSLNFFESGIRLTIEGGSVRAIEPWPDAAHDDAGASFPGLTFLQLLFGYRSLTDLEAAFPDCIARTEEARVLLDALFPVMPSQVWSIA